MEHDASSALSPGRTTPVTLAGGPVPIGAHGLRSTPVALIPTSAPDVRRALIDDADGLIRSLFDCGFTAAGVQSRHQVGGALSHEITSLIDALDSAIREIRRALLAVETAVDVDTDAA